MEKIGKASFLYKDVYLKSSSCVTGPKEKEGNLKDYIDKSYDTLDCLEKSWEKAEIRLQDDAFNCALNKTKLCHEDIELVVSGDLNNQIVVSSYMMRKYQIPYIGVYGACSTATLSMIVAANYISTKVCRNIACITSSHYATSERQFRYPTEYGGQKPISTTSTVTGSGCSILSTDKSNIKVIRSTIGKVVDHDYQDAQDLGTAMAPACANTLKQHFEDFQIDASEYDLILTGDLSTYGSKVFLDILKEYQIELPKYNDCGLMVYDLKKQEVYSGGSGCGCASIVLNGYVIKMLEEGLLNKVLLIATGALFSQTIICQKESIPGIAHAIALERVRE